MTMLLSLLLAFAGGPAATSVDGSWEGTIDAGGTKLRVVLHVAKKDGVYQATLDSPDQGANGLPISSFTVTGDAVKFELGLIKASYEGKLAASHKDMEGTWKQSGAALPLKFVRIVEKPAPKKPEKKN